MTDPNRLALVVAHAIAFDPQESSALQGTTGYRRWLAPSWSEPDRRVSSHRSRRDPLSPRRRGFGVVGAIAPRSLMMVANAMLYGQDGRWWSALGTSFCKSNKMCYLDG